MNNEQFRKLLSDTKTPARQDGASSTPKTGNGATPSALGSKRTSMIPMTPRTVRGGSGVDFARQVAERNAAGKGTKKFKSSAAPKGSKLGSGYQDRTLERRDIEDDERGARILALEEQMKLGQLDQSTFEALRDQITGGDVSATHLVKGLDRKLLQRIKQGEDVMGTNQKEDTEAVDEELDKLEEMEVARIEREKSEKKGEMAPPPQIAGGKRTRDQIMAELKAQRKAAAEARAAARPELGSHFRDISAKPRAGARIERDEKGREVMITVDEDGNVKKKVRKVQATDAATTEAPQAVEKAVKFLDEGITLPTLKEQKKVPEKEESEEEDDIFADAGGDYNPLGDDDDDGDDDSDDDSSDEDGEIAAKPSKSTETPTLLTAKTSHDSDPDSSTSPEATSAEKASMPPPPVPIAAPAKSETFVPRNYFKSASSESAAEAPPQNPFNDANFLAAIKKASALSNVSFSLGDKDGDGDEDEAAKEARLKKRAAMLANNDRDLDDMDLGFGSSRFGDAEDAEEGGSKIKLSEWKGTGAGDDDDEEDEGKGSGKGGEKKKRSRKRKGDKNSAKDVLGVLERRKESGK